MRTRLLERLRARRARRLRIELEDALKHLHAAEEHGRLATVESVGGALGVSGSRAAEIVRELHDRGLVLSREGLELTPAGRRWARSIVRAHRVWERYLADEVRKPAAVLHRLADRKEHRLGSEEVTRLEARLGYPEHDPHGDPIPTAAGGLAAQVSVPLTVVREGTTSKIVHLEDEPEIVYERIAALGLEPGQAITVHEISPERIVFEVDGLVRELPPLDAANVFVAPARLPPPAVARTLADLPVGGAARVKELHVSGLARRRLLDLGFTPGTRVECALVSPLGEPKAYRIRGTLIALRPEQARRVEVEAGEAEGEG